jgi:hypothetical protein
MLRVNYLRPEQMPPHQRTFPEENYPNCPVLVLARWP